MLISVIRLIGILFLFINSGYADDKVFFPGTIFDIDGEIISIDKLAEDRTICVITVKATWCPVCREQLIRIRDQLADFRRCNLTFLGPWWTGSDQAVAGKNTFPFPFYPG